MENVFLFTGENAYALHLELGRWIAEFTGRHGEENLARLSTSGLSPSAFINEVAASPFIAERRLIVVDGVPSFSTEDAAQGKSKAPKGAQSMRTVLEQVHPQSIVLFVAPKPDRRLSATKELLGLATVRTFAPLKSDALLRWMQEEFRAAGAEIEPAIPSLLLERTGEDQQMLSQEIAKLSLVAVGRPVTRQDIEALVLPSAEQTIWRLLDLIGEGRAEEAVLFCRELLKGGESAQGIWSIFLWIVTSFASVVSVVSEGTTSVQGVMQAADVKFGAARALLPLARSCTKEQLNDLLVRVADADIGLKTGEWKAGADSEEELFALIDRCLLVFPRRGAQERAVAHSS
ncbi:MAG: DNA polymerase III subunit delta [Candidatus Peregrinibacteria bacterium]